MTANCSPGPGPLGGRPVALQGFFQGPEANRRTGQRVLRHTWSVLQLPGDHSIVTNVTQIGEGTSSTWPVGVRRPLLG